MQEHCSSNHDTKWNKDSARQDKNKIETNVSIVHSNTFQQYSLKK